MTISPELLKKVGGVVVTPKENTLDVSKLTGEGLTPISKPAPKPQVISKESQIAIDQGKADPIDKSQVNFRDPTLGEKISLGFSLDPRKGSAFYGGLFKDAIGGGISGIGSFKDRVVGGFKGQQEASKLGFTSLETEQKRKDEYNKILAAAIAKEMDSDSTIDSFFRNIQKSAEEIGDFYYDKATERKLAAGIDPTETSFIEKLGQATPSALTFAMAALATGGTSAYATTALNLPKLGQAINVVGKVGMVLSEASMEADQARQDILQKGGTEQEAMKAYDNTMGLNAMLISITNKIDKIWDVDTISTVKELFKATTFSGIGEGFQEATQQIIQNTQTNRPIWDGVADSFLIGLTLGAGVKGVTGVGGVGKVNINEDAEPSKEKILEILNEKVLAGEITPEQKAKAEEILDENTPQERKDEILQESFQEGTAQDFIEEQKTQATDREILVQDAYQIYNQILQTGVSETQAIQEVANRIEQPVEAVKSAFEAIKTEATPENIPSLVAQELLDQHNKNTEIKPETPDGIIKSIAEETIKQEEAMAPNVIKDMENDAEMQQDWENNYKIDFGDLTQREVYLRGQADRLVQRAAKTKVQEQIKQIREQKENLKKEYVKNNTEVTKEDVKKAIKERSPKKANKVLNQVGKKKTMYKTKQGVRVNRIEDTDKVSKKQLEKRAKAEGTFLDMKPEKTELEAVTGEQSDLILEYNTIDLNQITEQNAYETKISKDGMTFVFRTEDLQDFMQGRDPEEIRFHIIDNRVYLIDTSYGTWDGAYISNSIVGRVEYFEPQKETLFQSKPRNRYATRDDIEKAFREIPLLKYVRVEMVPEIRIGEGRLAWGSYFNGLIKYVDNPRYGTLPHEAFHAFVDLVLPVNEQENLYNLARTEMRKDGYKGEITNLQAEEYLAEKFEDYYIQRQEKSAFRKWFDRIIDALKALFDSQVTIEDYYNSVFDPNVGLYVKPNLSMQLIDGDFLAELNPKTTEEARQIIEEAEITQEEKNFLNNLLDNPAYNKKTDWEAFKEEINVRKLQVEGKIRAGRKSLIQRNNENIGLPEETPGFAFVVDTELNHGARTNHGFIDGGKAIGWASVADTGDTYQIKEIQKVTDREMIPAIQNLKATEQEKTELKKIHQNYMDAFVIALRDQAANDGKILKFPSPEKAHLVNPQAKAEVIESVYDKAMKESIQKFTNAEFVEDAYGGDWVVYPTDMAKLTAHRFKMGDVFEMIQQNNLTTRILKRIGDRKTISKQYVADLVKMPDIKKVEKELINDVLKGEPQTINVEEFSQKVRAELLPLTVRRDTMVESRKRELQALQEAETRLKSKYGIYMEQDMDGGIYPVDEDGEGVEYDDQPPEAQEDISLIAQNHERMQDGERENRYEGISLRETEKGEVKEYNENVYESPIKTKAGGVHFSSSTNYFGHTRIEDMADGETRRVIEVQSDLYQRDRIEREMEFDVDKQRKYLTTAEQQEVNNLQGEAFQNNGNLSDAKQERLNELEEKAKSEFLRDKNKLSQYNNPSAHFRMIREEIRRAANEGIKKLQIPNGITALKIEGHWSRYSSQEAHGWKQLTFQRNVRVNFDNHVQTHSLSKEDLKVGLIVVDSGGTPWIIVDANRNTGNFDAVRYGYDFISDAKNHYEESDEDEELDEYQMIQRYAEEINGHLDDDPGFAVNFSIGETKKNEEYKKNPIYKFYEEEVAKYVKNTFNAKEVTDPQKVTWYEIEIKPEMTGRVEAFKEMKEEELLTSEKTKKLGLKMLEKSFGDKQSAQEHADQYWAKRGVKNIFHHATKEENPFNVFEKEKAANMDKGLRNGISNVNGLYVGKDPKALHEFYNMAAERGENIMTFEGNPKLLDMTDETKMQKFVKQFNTGEKIEAELEKNGYDGVVYFDPYATGEEIVITNTSKLKLVAFNGKRIRGERYKEMKTDKLKYDGGDTGYVGKLYHGTPDARFIEKGEKIIPSDHAFGEVLGVFSTNDYNQAVDWGKTKRTILKPFRDMPVGIGGVASIEKADGSDFKVLMNMKAYLDYGRDEAEKYYNKDKARYIKDGEDIYDVDGFINEVAQAHFSKKGYDAVAQGTDTFIIFNNVKTNQSLEGEKFKEMDPFERLSQYVLRFMTENNLAQKKETFINRVAKELEMEIQTGFYTPQRIREELAKAETMYEEDKQKTIAIAEGIEDAPENVNSFAIGRYVLNKATEEGNAEVQKSVLENLSKVARQEGQKIAMLRGQITIDSPNQFINQLKEAKEDLVRKKFKPLFTIKKAITVDEVVDNEVKKLKKKKQVKSFKDELLKQKDFELDTFLEAIKC